MAKSLRHRIGGVLLTSAIAVSTALWPATPAAAASETTSLAACVGWCAVATFDGYNNGSLRTQGSWQVNTPGAADGAHAGDEVPPGFSGKTMINKLNTSSVQYRGNAYAALGDSQILDGASGTLFFEVATADLATTNLNLGLSADASPGLGFDTTGDALDLDDYAVQVNLGAAGLSVRDGGTTRLLDNVAVGSGTIYSVWLAVNNADHTYQIRVRPDGGTTVLGSAGGQTTFAFRNATPGALVSYLHLNDPIALPTAESYIDNIYLDPSALVTTDPAPRFDQHLSFDGYNLGAVNGQDGWTSTGTSATVVADPARASNRVLSVSGANQMARREIPSIAQGTTGTLFFRMRKSGTIDASLGLSDVAAASTFADFEAQVNHVAGTDLRIRAGATPTTVGTINNTTWQCVWVVANNASDTVKMYSRGGPYSTLTRLPVSQEMQYAFRNGTSAGLNRFFAINGATSPGQLLIDDIAVDALGETFRVPGGAADSCEVTPAAEIPLVDPIPETVTKSGVGVRLTEIAGIPTSGTAGRINFVGELPDGSGRLYVPALNGSMYLVKNGVSTKYLDLTTLFPDFVNSPNLGTGFGFVAVAPDFATTGRFYTVHTEAGAALTTQVPDLPAPATTRVHGVITEWTATDPAAGTFAGSRREVLRLGSNTFLHGIQEINFNPTALPGSPDRGLLYVAVGDGEEVPNFTTGPQNLAVPQGKILRIDPLGTNGSGGGYGIPTTNPFVGQAGKLGEVYAYGLRNPHRFSWDAATGKMYVGMIGEANIDAVYQVEPGDNYGWNEREGAFVFKKTDPTNVYPLPANWRTDGYTYPVASYDHDTGLALLGGFVYRGTHVPDLVGKYVFGDIVSGRLFYTEAGEMIRGEKAATIRELTLFTGSGSGTTLQTLAGNSRVDLRLGQDAAGEIYATSKANGKIWKIGGHGTPFASCAVGANTVTNVMAAADWAPLTPSRWSFPGTEIVMTSKGVDPGLPRRPYEYAVLTSGPQFGSVQIDAEVRLDAPVTTSDRDVVLLFGYQSPTKFNYVHLSQDNTIYAHNGIFVVNEADRLRIDNQWTGTVGAPSAVTDTAWHQVRVKHCTTTGEIAVYVNGSSTPLMTATDTTLTAGRVGFGSFDNTGSVRNLMVTGSAIDATAPVTTGTVSAADPAVVTLTATDNTGGSGVSKIEYRIAPSATWIAYATPVSVPRTSAVQTVEFRATDVAGNLEATKSVIVPAVVPPADTTAPVTTGTVSAANPAIVTLAATDNTGGSGVSKVEYRIVPSTTWVAYSAPVSVPKTSAVQTVEFRATDVAGNVEATKSVQVPVAPDTTAPVTTGTVSAADPAVVTLTATDAGGSGVSKIEYRIAPSTTWIAYTTPVSVPKTSAAQTVEFRATDVAGNVEATKSVTVPAVVPPADTTAPVTTGTVSAADPAVVTLTATDAGGSGVSKIEYRLVPSATWVTYTAAVSVPKTASIQSVEFRATDIAGNVEATKSVQVPAVVPPADTTAPVAVLTISPVAPVSGWHTSEVLVSVSATDNKDAAPVRQINLGSGWVGYAAPVTLSADGTVVVQARASDVAGNVSEVKTVTVKIDAVAPVSSATVDEVARKVTIVGADATSGLDRIEYQIGSGDWATYTGAVTVPGSGAATVFYRAIDKAGLVQNTQQATVPAAGVVLKDSVTVGATAPSLTYGSATVVSVRVSGAGGVPSGDVEVRLGSVVVGGGTLANGRASVTLTDVLPAGSHSLSILYAGDLAFAGSTDTVEVTVAKATSSVTGTLAASTVRYGNNAVITVKVTAPGGTPDGAVTVKSGNAVLGSGMLVDGKVTFTIRNNISVKVHQLVVSYAGNSNLAPSTTTVLLTVLKAKSTVKAVAPPTTMGKNSAKVVRLQVTTTPTVSVIGTATVNFTLNGVVKATTTAQIRAGAGAFTWPAMKVPGVYRAKIAFNPTSTVEGSTTEFIVTVT